MKKLSLLLFASLVLAVGCMDIETKVAVNPDGSGTIEETFMIKKAAADLMNKKMAAKGQGGAEKAVKPVEEKKMYKLDELKEKAAQYGPGVVFKSVDDVENATHKGYKAVYAFEDISKIKINQNPGSKMGKKSASPEKGEFVTFAFKKSDEPTLSITVPEKKPGKKQAQKPQQKLDDAQLEKQLQQMRMIFDGMRMAMVVQVNGTIKKTNAQNVKDSTITLYDIDFSKLLNNKEKLMEMSTKKSQTMEETKAMLKDVPGLVVETQKKVKVTFSK